MKSPFRLLAVLLALHLALPMAYGEGNPTVAVPPLPGQDTDRARQGLVKALRESGRFSIVDVSAVNRYLTERSRSSTEAPKTSAAQAADKLAKGQAAYNQLKVKDSIRILSEAKVAYRGQLSDETAFQGLRVTQFHLAMAYLANKDRTKAKEELRQVYLLDPERDTRKLPERLYPPNIRQLYAEVKKEISAKERGDVEVVSRPPGALSYFDGRSLGVTPSRIQKVPAGEHFIKVVLDDHETFTGSKFIVGGPNRIEIELSPTSSENLENYFSVVEVGGTVDHKRAAFLDEMGVGLGADLFLFVRPEKSAVRAQLYDQRTQELSISEIDGTPEGLVKKLTSRIDSDGYVLAAGREPTASVKTSEGPLSQRLVTPDGSVGTLSDQLRQPPPPPPLRDTEKSWIQNPWLWAVVGGALLAGAGGVLLFTDIAKSDATTGTLTVTPP